MSEHATVVLIDQPVMLAQRSVAELFELGSWLVAQNADLPSPFRMCQVYPRTAELSFQFAPEPASLSALVGWAQRFGGVIWAGTATGRRPYRWCRVQFPFCGVPVAMWTHLPVPESLPFDRPAGQAEERQ
jgi:hypothetical protein